MVKDYLKEYRYSDGELQRVHVFSCESFNDLLFGNTSEDSASFRTICDIYDNYLIKAAPYIFKRYLLFHLPNSYYLQRLGIQRLFQKHVRIKANGTVVIKDDRVAEIYDELNRKGLVHISKGYLPGTKIISVGNFGYLSKAVNCKMKVNSSFFIFDPFDCASEYDEVGTPFGLMIKNGLVINPPLFNREALLVRGNTSSIRNIDLSAVDISIKGHKPIMIYSRPSYAKTAAHEGYDVIVVKNMVVDIKRGGKSIVPASGFVLSYRDLDDIRIGDQVEYRGFEDVDFAIQVGNSAIIDGKISKHFISSFYNIRKPFMIAYPPSLYPLGYEKDRAARVALGTDSANRPHVILFEGASKLGHQKGKESCGASLLEVGKICQDLGLVNAVNLDGGGSAVLYIDDQRSLRIADRKIIDGSEAERPIPSYIYHL